MNNAALEPEHWLGNFGLAGFRPGQRSVIDAILAGKDTLCIMPTGGGKSLCFQLPTIAREGVTIVISPLIALMKDQVDSLHQIGIPATFINSSLPQAQQHSRINGMVNGEYKLIYIAPERLRSNSFMRAVQKTQIQLLAVDEAHCISQWGHDFRPDYARLGRFRKRIGNPQTVALTATATRFVQDDIAQILELDQPARFVTGFARSNLSLQVQSPNGNAEKDHQLIEFLKSHSGCGIIYASTRKSCEHLVELLSEEIRRNISFYHAGIPTDQRRDVQEKFMSGEIEVIVATNAFGMGIDKPDLRFVIHYNLPGSIEAYYQEAGRAGRDGKPSECLMLYSFQDKFIQEFFIENSYPSRETIKQIYDYLCGIPANPIETTLQDIKDDLGLSIGTSGIGTCEGLLEKAGAIERLDSKQNAAAIRIDSELPTLIDLLPRDARSQRHVMRGLEKIVGTFRGERILFQPTRFAKRLEMRWDSVNRAIRQLVKLPMVDYIPPFRGRAVHVVDRTKPFSNLDIDFAELAKRKKSEYEKLQSVIRLATTRRCRQLEILEYFGDPDRHLCGNCDNCGSRELGKIGTAANSNADACMYAAQVALSGTARTHGRIGKTLIAQMLTGSSSKKIKQLGLDRLSTFGLLKKLRQSDVVSLMEFLIQQGYIQQVETTKFRPVISISPTGKQLMSGEAYIDLPAQMPGDLVNAISVKLIGKKPHLMATGPSLPEEMTLDANPVVAPKDKESPDVTSDFDVTQGGTASIQKDFDAAKDAANGRSPFAETEPEHLALGDRSPVDVRSDEEPDDDEETIDDEDLGDLALNDDPSEMFGEPDDDEWSESEPEGLSFPAPSGEPSLTNSSGDAGPRSSKPTASPSPISDPLSGESVEIALEPVESAKPVDAAHSVDSAGPVERGSGRSGTADTRKQIRIDLPDPKAVQPTFYWTWRLLADGYDVEHLQQVRQIDKETVFDHAIRAMENDLPAEMNWLLPTEKILALQTFVAGHHAERTSNLIAILPQDLSPKELIYYLKCQR